MSHLNPCPYICDSPPPRWCLSSIQFPRIASQFHPCPISNPSGSQDVCLTYSQALSHLHPGLKILASAPSMYFLSSIQAQKKCKSTQSRPISNSFWSQDVFFTSVHFLPHQLPGPKILVSSPSMYRLISIQVQRFLSHLHPCTVPLPPG